jgi:uncharacterized protein (TIGR02449 family)
VPEKHVRKPGHVDDFCVRTTPALYRPIGAGGGALTARCTPPYSSAMDHDINQLGDRLDILLGRFGALHDENIALRTRVAALEGENRVLGDKVEAARDKVRSLLERLPQE